MKKFLLSLLTIIAVGLTSAATDYSTGAIPKDSWSAAGTDAELNNISWNISITGSTYLGYDTNSSAKGIQIGTGEIPCTSATISTEGISGSISKVTVNASTAKSGNCTIAVKVNGTNFLCNNKETAKLTTSAATYTFTGEAEGKIEIIYTNSAKKAVYLKQIDVTYSDGSTPVEPVKPSEPTVKYGDTIINGGAEVSVTEGTQFNISAQNATKIVITDGNKNELVSYEGSEFTWTPDVMDKTSLTVTASNDEGESVKDFSLEVTEKVIVPGEFDFVNNDYGMKRLSGTTQEYNPDPVSFNDAIVTVTLTGKTRLWDNKGIRFYTGSKFIITAKKGYYITSIIFDGSIAQNVTIDNTKNNGSWTGASEEVEFVTTHKSGNKEMPTLTVKVEAVPDGVHDFTTVDIEDSFVISKDAESAEIIVTGVHAESDLYYKFTATPAETAPESAPRKVADHAGYTKAERNADNNHAISVSEAGTLELYAYHPATDSKSDVKTITVTKQSDTTAIDAIGADTAEGEAEYFNLQGVRINPENAAPGLYIRRQGGKAAKVLVKK